MLGAQRAVYLLASARFAIVDTDLTIDVASSGQLSHTVSDLSVHSALTLTSHSLHAAHAASALTLHDAARNQPPSPAPGSAMQALHVKSAVGLHAYDSCIGIVAHVSINVRGNLIMFAADDQSGSSNNTIKIERIRMPWAVSGDFREMAPH